MFKRAFASSFVLLILIVSGPNASAATLQTILRDTQHMTNAGSDLKIIWWIPQLYWEVSLADQKQITPEARQQVLGLLASYNIIAVVDVTFDSVGAIHSKPEAEVVGTARLNLDGTDVERIPEADLPDGMKNLLGGIRPVIQNGLGAVGKSMYLLVYPSKRTPNGKGWEYSTGKLTFGLAGKEWHWKLPLSCTLPIKRDKKTGDEFPGNYMFNPFTGEAL